MRNLKMTALVAGALVGGLVLGGVGIAAAQMRGTNDPAAPRVTYGTVDTTQPVTPPSTDTTQPVTPSVDPTDTVRPPMPSQARGHAYGRTITHMHSGLHRGQGHVDMHVVVRGMSRAGTTRASGSMMNR